MQKIFISYRRDDSRYAAGRIADRLALHFGEDHVFMDIQKIPLGIDFRQYVQEMLEHCEVVLAIIGDDWLVDGKAPSINTRIEVATALARRDIPVIPVLVGNAPIPGEDQLPDDLKALSYRNGIKLDADRGFDAGMQTLIEAIERETRLESLSSAAGPATMPRSAGASKTRSRIKLALFGLVAAFLLAAALYYIDDYFNLEYTIIDVSRGSTETIRLAPRSSRVFGFTVDSAGVYDIAVISTPKHGDQGWSLFEGESEEALKKCDTDHPHRGTETCSAELRAGQIYELEVENLMGDDEDEDSEPVYFTITIEKREAMDAEE